MGNNASATGADLVSPSSPNPNSRPPPGSTHRTHSLPLDCHRHQFRHRRHNPSHHWVHQAQSDRRNTVGVSSPSSTRRSSSRLRQALPNFVSNVSAAIGQKLPWSGGNAATKRRFQSASPITGANFRQCAAVVVGKSEKRSRSKTREHCRLFRELVADWRLSDLHCLVVEFEAALAVRELRRRADCTRPMAASLKDDFSRLFHQLNTGNQATIACDDSSADALLLLDGRVFAVHRAFLSRRCSFFRRVFLGSNSLDDPGPACGASACYNYSWRPTIPVTFPSSMTPLNAATFGLLLEYLYTGELASASTREEDFRALVRFNDEQQRLSREGGRCGDEDRNWTTLEDDVAAMLKEMADSNGGADALLIFTNSNEAHLDSSMENMEDTGCEQADEAPVTFENDPRSKRAPPLAVAEKRKTRCCQFKCHSVVLAARSPFFLAIIRKRRLQDEQRQQQEPQQHRPAHRRSASSPCSPWRRQSAGISSYSGFLEIVLDESVIPRQYAPVLLHAMYTDEVDLSLVMRDCIATAANCLTEVQAIAAGKCQLSPVDEATEIYQIARFLEFDKLAQGCEDIIVSYITLETLPSIYSWSMESYGSAYVQRHCVNYLCQEFGRFCSSLVLFDTDESLLVEVLKSDYVQASELEILNAVIRWGEHQLVRRIEEREPNILIGTTHSISRKGVKRADLSDEELKEILVSLLPLVRIDYILPPNHAILENALSRGLINFPSVDLLSGSQGRGVLLPPAVIARRRRRKRSGHNRHSPSALVRSCSSSQAANEGEISLNDTAMEHKAHDHWSKPHRRSAGPRLFLPYLEESRALLEKRIAESPDQLSSLINHHPPVDAVSDRYFVLHRSGSSTAAARFPDTLYMVDGGLELGANCGFDYLDTSEITVPPSSVLLSLQERVDRLLRTSTTVKRALACGCSYHRSDVLKQIRLRAIREFGLLDSTLAILDSYGHVASPSLTGRPSFCSSAPLSPIDLGEGLQYVDSEPGRFDDSGHYMPPSPAKRRFRSQPELSQCDVTGCATACMDWPDLMVSSLAPAASVDDNYSALCPTRRSTSVVSTSAAAPMQSTPTSSSSVHGTWSIEKYEDGESKRDAGPEGEERLRQQFADLTQQICDLVVVGETGDGRTMRESPEREPKRQHTPV